ncbi:MAG: hypothetical protein OHK0036_10550 [Bacteroidia bacterium]
MQVIPYNKDYFDKWNQFVLESDNGNFLFHRNFMEYHSDRFLDASLLLLDEKGNIQSVIPANKRENAIYSHQGLTYGGVIMKERKHIREVIRNFYYIMNYYKQQGIERVVYKPVPNYITQNICDVEHFIMKMINAELIRVDTSFVTHLYEPIHLQERRKRSIKKAEKNSDIKISIDNNFTAYWKEILEPNLWERYKAKPVHSLDEIVLLHQRFPENILQANAYIGEKIAAGITIFIFEHTIHCQYISSTDEGRNTGALDLLFFRMIENFKSKKKYFSMGTSNNEGNDLNLGVSEFKEGFDAHIYAHFHYQFSLQHLFNLEKFI